MKLDPRHLVAIELIRRTGGLTRAAEAIGTSQPALSRLVSDLEVRLDGSLFDRNTRPWRLTKLGLALARQGASILFAQERAANEVESFRSGTGGRLRIAGPPFFTDGVISRLLPEFRRRYPDVTFLLRYGYGQELREAVIDGRADLAIYPREIGELDDELAFTMLLEASNRIVCRDEHPILKLAYPSPLALLDYGWVSPPDGSPLAADMVSVLSEMSMQEARIVFFGGSLASVLSYLQNSDCLSVLPEATIAAMGPVFQVRPVPIEARTARRAIGVLTKPVEGLDFTTRTMIDFLIERVGNLS